MLRAEGEALCNGRPIQDTSGSVGVALGGGGSGDMCFLAPDGSVSCASNTDRISRPIHGLSHVVQLVGGDGNDCARYEDGSRIAWGDNLHDQFGPVGSDWGYHQDPPGVLEPPIEGGLELAFGRSAACQRTRAGELWCWGVIPVRPEQASHEPVPQKVPGLTCVTTAAVGWDHMCALAKGGLYCWGVNKNGQLGDGTTESRSEPRLVVW